MDRFHAMFKSEKTASKEAEVKKILTEFWQVGQGDPVKYRRELIALLGSPARVDEVETAFRETFTKYDLLSNVPRLKSDPYWSKVDEGLESIRSTGKCFFCGSDIDYSDFLHRSLCTNRDCARIFFLKPDVLNEVRAEQEVSVSVAMEKRWARGFLEG